MLRSLSRWMVLPAVVLSLGLVSVARAEASCPPSCTYRTVTCYKTVVVVEDRTEACTRYITRYDDCGCPYQVAVTCYRTVQVPVRKVVAYTRVVKVYE